MNDLIPVDGADANAIVIGHDLYGVLGERLEAVAESRDASQARELLADVAYQLLYEVRNQKGFTSTDIEALAFIKTYLGWLVETAGYKVYARATMMRQAEAVNQALWDEAFDGRRKLAAKRFQARVQEVDNLLPAVVQAIRSGDFDQIPNYIALVKLDMENVGYKSPGRVEIFAGSGADILTEADKELAARALEEVREYERALEGRKQEESTEPDIIEAEFYEEVWGDDEEE